MRILLLSAALLLSVPSARAQEVGDPLLFGGRSLAGPHQMAVQPASAGVIFAPAPSDPVSKPFDTVAFHGVLQDPNVRFEVSVSAAGGGWGPWIKAELHAYPGGRFWGVARLPSAASGRVRIRALDTGMSGPQTMELFVLEVFDSKEPEESSGASEGQESDEASVPKPEVISRSAWGARSPNGAYSHHTPKMLTQHHTQGNYPKSLQDAKQEMRVIQDYHMNTRKWMDIGYHFLVDPQGNIFQGRPENVIGAHVLHHNTNNVGISFMGCYHEPYNHQVTEAQLKAVQKLGRWLLSKYGIPAREYKGHRDRAATKCPGDILYAFLDRIRASFGEPVSLDLSSARRAAEKAAKSLSPAAASKGAGFDGVRGTGG